MVLYARNDIKTFHNPANNHTHSRPKKANGTPVPVWGVSCPPCEQLLHGNPAWSGSRYKIPLTPDEVDEARDAQDAAERALHQQQLALAQQATIAAMAAKNAVPDQDPDDVAVTSDPDEPSRSVEGSGPDPVVAASDYAVLSKTDLKDLARERGLPVSGTSNDIIARLVASDSN